VANVPSIVGQSKN